MNRKDKPLLHRIFTTVCTFTLIGAGMYAIFAGLNLTSGIVIGLAIASIATPVVIEGGSILEVIFGVFEALLEGLMGVLDAIGNIFNF